MDAGDRYRLTGPLPPLAIPSTLHDSYRPARPPRAGQGGGADRRAIGREFSHELLAALADCQRSCKARSTSWSSELVFRRGTPPDATYTFKHALVQDAAYGTLLSPAASSSTPASPRCWKSSSRTAKPSPSCSRITAPRRAWRAGDHYWRRAGERSSALGDGGGGRSSDGAGAMWTLPDSEAQSVRSLICSSR